MKTARGLNVSNREGKKRSLDDNTLAAAAAWHGHRVKSAHLLLFPLASKASQSEGRPCRWRLWSPTATDGPRGEITLLWLA